MEDDERCCGTGTCIIDAQGHCWCGQQWDGEKMCRPPMDTVQPIAPETDSTSPAPTSGSTLLGLPLAAP